MLSVIVPSYNSARTIRRTLDGLLRQPREYVSEIIVVDSSDDGDTRLFLREYEKKGVRVIRRAVRTIPAQARNIGAAHAAKEVLAFIDSDAYPASDWAARIAAAFRDGAVAGGGSIMLPPEQHGKSIALAQWFLQFNEYVDSGKPRAKIFVPSCNLFCERALFDQVGGFPDIRASEDVLFGYRLRRAGVAMRFVPDARVFHLFRERVRSFAANQALLGKYTMLYRRAVPGAWLYWGIIPVILFPAILVMKLARMTLRIVAAGGGGRIAAFARSLPYFVFGIFCWSGGFLTGCFSGADEARRSLRVVSYKPKEAAPQPIHA